MIDDQTSLRKLKQLRKHLIEERILIILPDHEEKAATAGMAFYLKYISYQDSDFSDVAVVLDKIIT